MTETTPKTENAATPHAVTLSQQEYLDFQKELALLQRKNALQALELELLYKERSLAEKQQEQDTVKLRQDNERLQKKIVEFTRELEALREAVTQVNHLLAPRLFIDLNSGELFKPSKVWSLNWKWPTFAVRLLLPGKDRFL